VNAEGGELVLQMQQLAVRAGQAALSHPLGPFPSFGDRAAVDLPEGAHCQGPRRSFDRRNPSPGHFQQLAAHRLWRQVTATFEHLETTT
jgi:hypothetical protein